MAQSLTRKIWNKFEQLAMHGIAGALGVIPWRVAMWFGETIGGIGYRPLGIRRHVAEKQIAAAFPDLSKPGVHRIARASYRHLGRTSIETALLPSLGRDGILRLVESVDGWEHVERAMSRRNGVIMVTGHFGNWELAGSYMAARGIPIDVIVREMANLDFDRYLNATRERAGMTVVYDREAVRRIPRSLRDGRAVAFVADQGVLGLASTFVTFFGRPAKTPRGAAVFALRFNSPVVFVVTFRKPNGRYHVTIEPVEIAETGDRERDTDAIVQHYTEQLEAWVRKIPEQYFWQHRRWRRQPPDTPPELRDPTVTA